MLAPPRELEGQKPCDTPSSVAAVSSGQNVSDRGDIVCKSTPIPKKRFNSSWARGRPGRNNVEGARGPLGLRRLHSSPEPLIDLIFVHGLRGGSIKTWRKGEDASCFWPKCWLPLEPGFANVNIHSFGYDSDWASLKPSILNVHDFGQSLLEEMRNSPDLRDCGERPIILIGHSMGGLVIKKAFILARDVPAFSRRIRCIFFLATPHRGSDYAGLLNNILAISGIMSSRHYIKDLTTGSTSIQLINDDFGMYAHDLSIFSFYETLRMNLGISSALIVEKSSAILGPGYKNERVQYVNSNHRDICKFENPEDPNYTTVKNALASAVENLLKDNSITTREASREQIQILRSYLGITDVPHEHHLKIDGSCQWIEARDDFQNWRDGSRDFLSEEPSDTTWKKLSIFWVHANPGTGKTTLASHVIRQLQGLGLECAYYYFHVGDKNSRSLGHFLRSICYQMASSNSAIRKNLFNMIQDGLAFDMDDSWTFWFKFFRKGILQAQIYIPQYWVIDAIDECSKYPEFFTMLKGEKPNFPVRLFITSRNIHDMQRHQRSLEATASIFCVQIPVQDSIDDIKRYLRSRIESLPIDGTDNREELTSSIVRKSNACFLWVKLVLDELENVYSNESIMKVLEKIPEGMIPYYGRTIKAMAANVLEKHIAKAILVWTVMSVRKLTMPELSQALKLDINTVLLSSKNAVEGLCGQLVSVDKNSGVIDLIHPTVREFLLSEAAGEFNISEPVAHERIASVCFQLLSGNEFRPPRSPQLHTHIQAEPSPLVDYAMTQFSEHVYTASLQNDELLAAVNQFFKANVLCWIDRLARNGDLHCLIRASKNLKAYLDRRAQCRSPLSIQVRNIDHWSIDLSRLVTQFGDALLQSPSSIYFLIPPLCPTSSAIYRQFGKRPDGLSVIGSKNSAWDDCIAHVSFGKDTAASVSCGENLIAVGMESGHVILYNHHNYQKEAVLSHKYPVDLVHITGRFILSCTTRAIVLQDLDGNTIWESRLRFRCLLLTSSENYIIAISQHGCLLKWDKMSGDLLQDQEFKYQNYDAESEHNGLASRPPHVASISRDMELLALGYRGGAVCLWETQGPEFLGWARDEEGRLAVNVLFNPNPNINVLLVIYTDHCLAVYDTFSRSLVQTRKMSNSIGLLSASCSPDGRTLVTTDSHGHMYIWDFESLSILYHVLSPSPSFRVLSFSSDGSCVVDVMDSGMLIWSPAVLVRKNAEEDASIRSDAIQLAVKEGEDGSRNHTKFTGLCAHPSQPVVFAGTHDGQVVAFSTKADMPSTVLYSHSPAAFITKLAICKDGVLASSDVIGVVYVWKLMPSLLKADSMLAKIRARSLVKQLCFSPSGECLLVATTRSDSVYRFDSRERKIWRWLLLPHEDYEEQHFSLLADGVLRRYCAESFPRLFEPAHIGVRYTLDEGDVETDIENAVVCQSTKTLVLTVRHDSGLVSASTTFLFDLSAVSPSAGTPPATTISPTSTMLPALCKHFVGISEQTKSLVFVHKNSWLSSVEMPGGSKRYAQHFFMPNEYLLSSAEVSPVKTAGEDVVFCSHGELVAVKNWLRFAEIKVLK